jgi:hypothetical protein
MDALSGRPDIYPLSRLVLTYAALTLIGMGCARPLGTGSGKWPVGVGALRMVHSARGTARPGQWPAAARAAP